MFGPGGHFVTCLAVPAIAGFDSPSGATALVPVILSSEGVHRCMAVCCFHCCRSARNGPTSRTPICTDEGISRREPSPAAGRSRTQSRLGRR